MSTRHLPRAIASRGKTAVEIERENFEKSQHVAINKAINTIECPVKEKHVRTTVLGTFKDHGAGTYWTIAGKLPLQGNPIVAWKFLHVLHKILRDGHQHSIPDSYKNHTILIELGKLWTHLKEGYGKLIACYCKLMVEKLNFHRKNKEIPGNLNLSDDQFAKICGSDVNNYFEISVEMLDYMDEILSLQQAVFGSLDMSRSNSMTNSGQCRLAPLILCIQDSCQLYDYIVKSLFRLHSSLPPDTLSGHRDRFLSMYKRLKQFYFSSSNLQYFKNLVQVPSLPDEPPNFLIASDFSKHVKPVAVVPDEPEPDPEPEIEDLIDTSEPAPPVNNFGNGFGPPEIDERDLLIERLTKEIQYLRSEIERLKLEDQKIIAAQKEEIVRLEKILSELRLSADRALKDNDELKKKLERASVHVGAAVKLTEAEKQARSYEDKFKKMKDIYQKLREEHVALLRTNGEITKKLDAEKRTVAEKEQLLKESKSEMDRLEQERKVIQESLKQSADETSSQLAMTMAKNTDLQTDKEHLENQLKMLEDTKSSLMVQLQSSEEECSNLQTSLDELEEEKRTQESSLSGEISTQQEQLTALAVEKESLDAKLNQEIHELKSKLEQEIADKNSLEDQLKQQVKDLESRLSQSQTDKQNTEKKLTDDMDLLQKTLIGSLFKTIQEGKAIIQDSLDQFENPTHIPVKCTAEFLLLRTEPVLSSLENLKETKGKYLKDKTELDNLVRSITSFSHQLGDSVLHGIATTHSANLEAGEELGNACRDAGESGLKVLNALEKGAIIDSDVDHTVTCIKKMISLAEDLVPKMTDVKEKEIGDMLDNEMSSTTSAIEEAARRIAELLEKTRDETTGVELKVNESILDSCTGLMHAIRILIERSRDLQREIVVQGRGTSTEKDFYKKNHRWTEGLLSAAKAVGWGATALMEAADKVVKGEGKFEELIVCSNEIAASTAQLVVASKVKADRRSKTLSLLSEASKGVTQNTGKVVGSAREGSQIIDEQGLMDFSKLSLMQSKRFEMQSQVRVLELEKELETERYKLGEIRKKHYQLAGASEGWDEDQGDEYDTESPRQPIKK